jgi:uncharacterized membrane protein
MQGDENSNERWTGYRLFPALWVIGIGALFLLRNLGVKIPFLDTRNWWAWFILIGAVAPLAHAFELYRANGRFDGAVVHHLFVGAAIVTVATLFILDLSWQMWWPLFMILGGIAMLGRGGRCHAAPEQTPPR